MKMRKARMTRKGRREQQPVQFTTSTTDNRSRKTTRIECSCSVRLQVHSPPLRLQEIACHQKKQVARFLKASLPVLDLAKHSSSNCHKDTWIQSACQHSQCVSELALCSVNVDHFLMLIFLCPTQCQSLIPAKQFTKLWNRRSKQEVCP
jgi:hypothetical protein